MGHLFTRAPPSFWVWLIIVAVKSWFHLPGIRRFPSVCAEVSLGYGGDNRKTAGALNRRVRSGSWRSVVSATTPRRHDNAEPRQQTLRSQPKCHPNWTDKGSNESYITFYRQIYPGTELATPPAQFSRWPCMGHSLGPGFALDAQHRLQCKIAPDMSPQQLISVTQHFNPYFKRPRCCPPSVKNVSKPTEREHSCPRRQNRYSVAALQEPTANSVTERH